MLVINSFEVKRWAIISKVRKTVTILILQVEEGESFRLRFYNLEEDEIEKLKKELDSIIETNKNADLVFKWTLQDIVHIVQKYYH